MTCSIDKDLIRKTIDFHGHNCPGLTIGIRAAELARLKLAVHKTANSLCVTETDMCGVDAIQFLTGCSFGKSPESTAFEQVCARNGHLSVKRSRIGPRGGKNEWGGWKPTD